MDVYVARQPILDRNQKLFAYELLFRDGLVNAMPQVEGDELTPYLDIVRAYEAGDWTTLRREAAELGIPETALPRCYVEALEWADTVDAL